MSSVLQRTRREGLAMLQEHPPDLVLLDLKMLAGMVSNQGANYSVHTGGGRPSTRIRVWGEEFV